MVNLRPAASALLAGAVGASLAATASAQSDGILQVHGSGTTNPSKCIWHIMAKLMEQIKIPTRLTYRAVGSGTGQKEFLGKDITIDGAEVTNYEAYNDFGAGDIPISRADWETWNSPEVNVPFVQLPFVLSSVSFFHSIPGVPGGAQGLNMTACLLAQIFGGEITAWDHPDILAENPNLNVVDSYPIYVGRRELGSSSTASITQYLHTQCPRGSEFPNGWPEDKVSKKIEWPPSTNACDGSGLMTACLKENPGAIGYIDSAHGHEEFLTEIRIKNGDGNFLTSVEAGREGIANAAKDRSKVPDSADGDFSEVAYYNQPGADTWPIALVSYIYVRKDLSFLPDPNSRTLLKAFARALYDEEYIGMCARFGQIPVPATVRDLALAGIEMIDDGGGVEWTFEIEKTQPGIGQGEYVISDRRQNFVLYEAENLYDDVKMLKEAMREMRIQNAQAVVGAKSGAKSGASGVVKSGFAGAAGALAGAALALGLF